jgi:hypothetical protein
LGEVTRQVYWYTGAVTLWKRLKKKPIGNPHQILNLAPKTTLEVRKAEVKAKLITRTYTLQSDKANPLGVTHRLGEVTRQVYWYTGAVTLWKRLLSLIMLCIMFSMSLRFSVLKILCVTMA